MGLLFLDSGRQRLGNGANDWGLNACIIYGFMFHGCRFLRHTQQKKMSKILFILSLFFILSCSINKPINNKLNPVPVQSKQFQQVDVNQDSMISIEEYSESQINAYETQAPIKWFLFIVFLVFAISVGLSFFTKRT